MDKKFDTIVLGLGAMGSASLYQLAKRGNKVLGIDQFSPPHTIGSTHGETRITRQAIGEGEMFTPLSLRSYEIFRELEKKTGKHLLEITGGLIIANTSKGDQVFVDSNHHDAEFFDNTLAAAKKFDIKHEILDVSDIRKKFPQFKVEDDELGYFEYAAGFLRPEECVRAQLSLSGDEGATIHTDEKVQSFSQKGNDVYVTTNRGEYYTQQLVVTAGPWISSFLDAELQSFFKVRRQVLYWFDVSNSFNEFIPGKFPIFIWETPRSRGLYGFPAIDGRSGGIKLAPGEYGPIVTPENADRTVDPLEIQSMYERFVAPFFTGIGNKCLKTAVCLYTATPDFKFVIDRHPQMPSVIICSPCSGHGFKHSAAIGECIAQLVTEGKTKIDISAFSISRAAFK